MLANNLKFLLITVVIILLTSCVKDLDFDQADNILLEPVIASSVVYSTVGASRFSENGTEITTVSDSIANVEIFQDDFVKDNLVKAELVFEVVNSINRTFNLQIDFIDDADQLQHTLTFDALPSSNGNDVITSYIEVFEDTSLEALKLTTEIIIKLSVLPSTDGTMLNEDSQGRVELKSKGIFYLNVNLGS